MPDDTSTSNGRRRVCEAEPTRELKARRRLWSCPSLSLLTVAAMLPDDFDVDYIDLGLEDLPDTRYDMAFFSPSTSVIPCTYELADNLRSAGTKVVMGGAHVSILPGEALEHADTVFVGEAEDTFKKFLQDLSHNRLLPVYRSNKLPDLSRSPVPRYQLVRESPYKSIPVQTSRGCPHQCEFCASSAIYGRKLRKKSVAQVRRELETIIDIWPRPFIFFTDDNMFKDEKHAGALLDMFRRYRFRWYAFSDVEVAFRPGLLQKMYDTGCRQLVIGFETLSDANLAYINKSGWKKGMRPYYKHAIRSIQHYGIGVVGSFVLGFDNDTPRVFDELYSFIDETGLYATNITVLTPFPGTRVYDRYKKDRAIITDDWSRYTGFELVHTPCNMTPSEFEDGYASLSRRLSAPDRVNKMLSSFKELIHANTDGRGRQEA